MNTAIIRAIVAVSLAASICLGWERNSSCGASVKYYFEPPQNEQGLVSSYDIGLFNELSQRATEDQFGNRLNEFQDQFAQRTGCLAWGDVTQRSLTRSEISQLTRVCICTKVRVGIIGAVKSTYACDLRNVERGSLHTAFATLGRRINGLHRFQVGLHGNHEILSQYDELFRTCYSRFFERVGEVVTHELASPVEQPREESKRGDPVDELQEANSARRDSTTADSSTASVDAAWILVIVEIATAAFVAFRVRRWLRLCGE